MGNKKVSYEKAMVEVVKFDNSDVISTSGGAAYEVWSSQNGYTCHGGLQLSGGDLKPPLN